MPDQITSAAAKTEATAPRVAGGLSGIKPSRYSGSRIVDALEITVGGTREVQVERAEFCTATSTRARDLKVVWPPSFRDDGASILTRGRVMIVNLPNTRAVIAHDRMWVFEFYDDRFSPMVQWLQQYLREQDKNRHVAQPFEFDVLEGLLIYECSQIDAAWSSLNPRIREALKRVRENASHPHLTSILELKTELASFEQRVTQLHDVLLRMLASDEDMAQMYLSFAAKYPKAPRDRSDHTEVEELLEYYLKHADDVLHNVQLLTRSVEITEKLVGVTLDSARNAIMQADLKVNIYTLCIGGSALGVGLFGMNVPIPALLSQSGTTFMALSAGAFVLAMVLSRGVIQYFNRRHVLATSGGDLDLDYAARERKRALSFDPRRDAALEAQAIHEARRVKSDQMMELWRDRMCQKETLHTRMLAPKGVLATEM